jgi:glycosyltransferase involved in cell wall biosynthesis
MLSPHLADLPLPISNCQGWPWTEDWKQIPLLMVESNQWPKVSIITPSFNQGEFLEETIRSVLLQGYPNLEYIIIDGGSNDNSVEIIKKYDTWLTYWVSEPDRGQSHAINKGFKRATGDVIAWLNSDDTYMPDTLFKVVNYLINHPLKSIVYGSALFIDKYSKPLNKYRGRPLSRGLKRMKFWKGWGIPQPTLFFKHELLKLYGDLDESFHYALDYEWIIRVTTKEKAHFLKDVLATYRIHGGSKTSDWNKSKPLFFNECERANRKYAPPGSLKNYPLWISWKIFRYTQHIKNSLSNILLEVR